MNDTASFENYVSKLVNILQSHHWHDVLQLAQDLRHCWASQKQLFLCGNGGSAANAIHLANDYLYGIAEAAAKGMRVHALSANPAVITCLANDISYEQVYAQQLAVHGQEGDLLIVFSGSGQSANIQEVLKQAKLQGIKSYAILGFQGGACKHLADNPIHFAIADMQISEDVQLIIGHMLMQWLCAHPPTNMHEEGVTYVEAACSR